MTGAGMKLTLILDPASAGVRASLVEEWDEFGRAERMEPMVRHFDADEEAILWGRALARRRGLGQIFLTDNRKTGAR
ncbi:MAG TPA: hypothetical protein VNV18_10715 [Stellaceae bacterium]|jgi:hypothetical protein|nr:hypothetical protein [Stellaceae bacterium]